MSKLFSLLARGVAISALMTMFVAVLVGLSYLGNDKVLAQPGHFSWPLFGQSLLIAFGLTALVCCHYQLSRYYHWDKCCSAASIVLVAGVIYYHASAKWAILLQPRAGLPLLYMSMLAIGGALIILYHMPTKRGWR